MTEQPMTSVLRRDVEARAGGGHAASGLTRWLGLASTPTFALMALWTGLSGGGSAMPEIAMHDASALNSMALMYALMGVFHAAPWLKLLSRRRR
jgi:hypothetical protein